MSFFLCFATLLIFCFSSLSICSLLFYDTLILSFLLFCFALIFHLSLFLCHSCFHSLSTCSGAVRPLAVAGVGFLDLGAFEPLALVPSLEFNLLAPYL